MSMTKKKGKMLTNDMFINTDKNVKPSFRKKKWKRMATWQREYCSRYCKFSLSTSELDTQLRIYIVGVQFCVQLFAALCILAVYSML